MENLRARDSTSRYAQRRLQPRILFVTGTDTGVGKTLLTGLLLAHLRNQQQRTLALKPFCSGGREEVEFLSALHDHEVDRDTLNPFYFSRPVTPMVAARKSRQRIYLRDAVKRIRRIIENQRSDFTLVEGAGGLLSPLGEDFSTLDLIVKLGCKVVVAARNRLGVLNHVALTVNVLQASGVKEITIVLMNVERDASSSSNAVVLAEILHPVRVLSVPFLGGDASTPPRVKSAAKKLKKVLARIIE